MSKTICTDPDAYQWQRKEEYADGMFGYAMCQVIKFDRDRYAVLYGTVDIGSGWEDDVEEVAAFFGYDADSLLRDHALFAECVFEYYMEEFAENPYGLSPVYRTPEEACARCDKLMGESHKSDWLHE